MATTDGCCEQLTVWQCPDEREREDDGVERHVRGCRRVRGADIADLEAAKAAKDRCQSVIGSVSSVSIYGIHLNRESDGLRRFGV